MRFCVFGSNELAENCVRSLIQLFPKSEIVIVKKEGYNKTFDTFCIEKELKTHPKVTDIESAFDYGFTIRFHEIIKIDVIERFKYGIINIHGGPLPEYRGSANHIFALLNGEKKFGVTLHYINEGIDEGPILLRKTIPIDNEETGFSLLNKTMSVGYELFLRILFEIKEGTFPEPEEQDLNIGKTYRIKDLNYYKSVDLNNIANKDLINRLKAFYHPTRESVITNLDGYEVELKLIKYIDKKIDD